MALEEVAGQAGARNHMPQVQLEQLEAIRMKAQALFARVAADDRLGAWVRSSLLSARERLVRKSSLTVRKAKEGRRSISPVTLSRGKRGLVPVAIREAGVTRTSRPPAPAYQRRSSSLAGRLPPLTRGSGFNATVIPVPECLTGSLTLMPRISAIELDLMGCPDLAGASTSSWESTKACPWQVRPQLTDKAAPPKLRSKGAVSSAIASSALGRNDMRQWKVVA